MKILIVNPILYTSETRQVNRASSIKDTMIYDLCLAFVKKGHTVTLAGAEDYKPTEQEEYPFEVLWLNTKCKKICFPNVLPYCPELKKVIKENNYDLIITSEVFSLNSLILSRRCKDKLIVWHELAKHNNILHKIPSKLWYGIIARLMFRNTKIVPRSNEAKCFIEQFCNNVSDTIIDHGVNLEKFDQETQKDNQFCISSQLIPRKHIEKSIDAFSKYLDKYDPSTKLIIMGDGEDKEKLINQVNSLGISDNVIFTGKLAHKELTDILKKSAGMLIYTEKDNNMISVVESIAVGTPVITTSVPYNASYIKSHQLGIVSDNWNEDDLNTVITNKDYIKNCIDYRDNLSTLTKVDTFISIAKKELFND